MKKVRLSLIALAVMLIFAGGMLLTSCEKTELAAPNESEGLDRNVEANNIIYSISDLPEIKVKNGVIVFNNEEEMFKTFKILTTIEYEDYLKWTKENDFLSLESNLYNILQKENALTEYYEKLQEEEVVREKRIKKYSDFTVENLKKGLIKEIQIDDSTSYLGFNTMRPELSYLLSTKNLVCVGDTIFQYNESNVKKIPNSDFSKISNLKNTEQTLSDNSIIVEHFSTNTKGMVTQTFGTPWINYINSDKERLTLTIQYNQYTGSNNSFATTFFAQMVYKKKIWGVWRYKNTTFTFKASNYKMKSTLSNGTSYTQTEYPRAKTYTNRSSAKRFYIENGYGGNLSQFTHTPHVYSGKLYFYVKAGFTINWGLYERYGLK